MLGRESGCPDRRPEFNRGLSPGALFAKALLGESRPRRIEDPTSKVDVEQLEWLASILPEFKRELFETARHEGRHSHKREQLEWLAQISSEHKRQLQRQEAAEALARHRGRQILERLESAAEEDWDPGKYPRLGGPPNAGWFAATGGALAAVTPRVRPTKPDSLVEPRQQHDALAQAEQPKKGAGTTGGAPQSAAPPAAKTDMTKREYVRLAGTEVVAGGGRVPDTDIDVRVYKDMTLGAKVDGKFLLDDKGNKLTEHAWIQLDADSDEAANCIGCSSPGSPSTTPKATRLLGER